MARGEKRRRNRGRRGDQGQAAASGPAAHGSASEPTTDSGSPAPWSPGGAPTHVLAIVGLGLLVAVSYFPATQAGFVWDDRIVTSSRAVQEWSGLWQLWFDAEHTFRFGNTREGHFWPLLYSTFWLEHKLWGFAPAGYHIVNLLLHFANTWLVWLLLRRGPGAWLIAAVFAVHPVHVEAVTWVIARKDLLSTLFYLTAALTYLRFVETRGPARYVLALALFVAGLLSKSMVMTLPAGLLIWHWWQHGRVTSGDLLRLLPFFVVGLGAGLADMAFYQRREAVEFDLSAVERVLIAARALWFYAGKLLWPAGLAVIYPRWDMDPTDLLGWAGVAAALAVAAPLWFFRHRIGRGPLAGAAFFTVTLSPVLGVVDSTYMQWSFVADRYQYLASLGLIAVVVGSAAHGAGRLPGAWRDRGVAVAGVVLVALGTLSWRQAGIYRDDVTFYRHIVALNPVARDAHLNLSAALSARGRKEDALAAALIAVEQRPHSADGYGNVGLVLLGLGRLDEAEQYLRRGRKADPRHRNVLRNLAEVLERQKRYEEALEVYEAVPRLNREDVPVHVDLGGLLLRMQRYTEVIESLKPVVALPSRLPSDRHLHARLHVQLSVAARELGRLDEARQHHQRALDLAPKDPWRLQHLAESLAEGERLQEALEWHAANIELNPRFGLAHAGMGETLFRLKRYDEAAERLEEALRLLPDSSWAPAAHFVLGRTAEARDRPEAAEEHYTRALAMDPRHTAALRHLISLRFAQQRYEETLPLFRTLIEVQPRNAEAHVNLAIVLRSLGRTDEALRSVDNALSLDPDLAKGRELREQIRERAPRP